MQCLVARLILFLSFFLFASCVYATPGMDIPYGASIITQKMLDLRMAVFYLCCVISTLVFAVLLYSLVKYRKSQGVAAAYFHKHLWVEVVWTVIPILILIALAFPTAIVMLHSHNTDRSALNIKITDHQWKLKSEYFDNNEPKNGKLLLEKNNKVVLPVNK